MILEGFLSGERRKMVEDKIKDNSIILDVGCNNPCVLLENVSFRIKKGIGIDPRPVKSSKENITILTEAFYDKLEFENNFFDHIISLALLEHLENPFIFLKENYRCLKKGGTVLLTTPSPSAHPILQLMSKLGLVNKEFIQQHTIYFSKAGLEKHFLSAGFKNVKIQEFQFGLNFFVEAKK